MMLAHSDDREVRHGREVMCALGRVLRGAGQKALADELTQGYELVLDAFIAGAHQNPVQHHAYVALMAAKLGLAERLPEGMLRVLCWTALLHDIGNAKEGPGAKIRVQDVVGGSYTAQEAIAQRRRHMAEGARMVADLLRGWHAFSEDETALICGIIARHDDPSVAELLSELLYSASPAWSAVRQTHKGSPASLHAASQALAQADWGRFGQALGPWADGARALAERFAARGDYVPAIRYHLFGQSEPLAALLRAADRLWMVTPDGLGEDLRRKYRKGEAWDPAGQISGNIKRHEEERDLYAIFFAGCPDDPSGGMMPGAGFYRTAAQRNSFRFLKRNLSRYTSNQWRALVEVPDAFAGDLLDWVAAAP